MKLSILSKAVRKLLTITARSSGGHDLELRGWGGGGFYCYCLYLHGTSGRGLLASFSLKYSKANVKNTTIENYISLASFSIIWLEGRSDLVPRSHSVWRLAVGDLDSKIGRAYIRSDIIKTLNLPLSQPPSLILVLFFLSSYPMS